MKLLVSRYICSNFLLPGEFVALRMVSVVSHLERKSCIQHPGLQDKHLLTSLGRVTCSFHEESTAKALKHHRQKKKKILRWQLLIRNYATQEKCDARDGFLFELATIGEFCVSFFMHGCHMLFHLLHISTLRISCEVNFCWLTNPEISS